MRKIVIISENKIVKSFCLKKTLTTVGQNSDFDVVITSLPFSGMAITLENEKVRISAIGADKKRMQGSWDKNIVGSEILSYGEFEFICMPESKEDLTEKSTQLRGWNLETLPKDPVSPQFPQQLLEFLLDGLGKNEGALFYRKENFIHTLASKNIKIGHQSESLMLRYLHMTENNVVRVNFSTHSMLFNAGLVPCDFLLVKTALTKELEVIIYLPEPDATVPLPERFIEVLIYLCAQNLSLHLIHKFNRKLEKLIPEFDDNDDFFWGDGDKMLRIKAIVDQLAPTNISLLLQGETGSGKDRLANYIQRHSPQSQKIVAINCAAIPKELAESVLFGHVKGAFTGAHKDQLGKVAEANGGTLFLDEVGELSLEIQGKLLRFLQDGICTPVGGKGMRVKARIISATNRDLKRMVREGQFREDLYFRLSEASLVVPPLRERVLDIPVLAKMFLKQACQDNSLLNKSLTAAAVEKLQSYPWPGNIRELLSVLRRSAVMCRGEIVDSGDLLIDSLCTETENQIDEFPLNLAQAKELLIKKLVIKALAISSDNKTEAAKKLGVNVRTLFRLIADSDKDGALCDKDVIEQNLNC
ncbi:MAG: hypothetical protein A2504_12855 [Bdellovibrionales bacterium RIFOXYD12_FULL_39_22]|nr:MAG: hypothetical protein A2385_03940 [Bdellovibrionales bacterium RIFOXYB1_FULL_39_21]OFZ40504.1 MAG: hypothetical protein A2485_02805 [Bdellovibrionales bacterium RIFOXYC12_FULL_39_17]OFZ49987.1 MAG: hypothetical protein A2404_02140 [Bdellovibrionales bacterium RIFOXYC1_FULL_39_130]OFZ73379.1 MAG: hypothetical protein A2451_04535 [Bdellovibrionales bacterium RIFOXYC2_FULL_39_8]OFZ77629.1 MAG: hypothetical protein A2560_04700 [Bdellovibrionales bacterium RIFOXYD1_FULL_39_84]OFZ96083.1 MAG: